MRAIRVCYFSHRLLITTGHRSTSASWITFLKSHENYHALRNCRIIHSTGSRFCDESTSQSKRLQEWIICKDKHNINGMQELNSRSVIKHVDESKEESVGNDKGVGSVVVLGEQRNHRGNKKSKIIWVCENCGNSDGQWWGTCRFCNIGTLKQCALGDSIGGKAVTGFNVSVDILRSHVTQKMPVKLTDAKREISELKWRIPLFGLFGTEIGRVLGGGLVPGSLILVGGDPGVGKSTLLLQIAALLTEKSTFFESAPVLYVSGEETVEQIASRADRLNVVAENIYLYSCTDMKVILEKIQHLSPRALIIDSIQTVYLNGLTGSAGSPMQVKECTSSLQHFAKNTNIPVLVIGHVTKAGDFAGPHVVEHIVDVVLYMEGQKESSHRILRSMKNRFGSTDELGIFEMSPAGLQPVSNPTEIFLSEHQPESEILAGVAAAVIMDGSRIFLIEIQALCVSGLSVSSHFNGIQRSRADMIFSILVKQIGLKMSQNAVFLNVVGGVSLSDTAGDLAIAAAICSSWFVFPVPRYVAFIGEIGLAGELRSVSRMEKRIKTVAKVGYKKCIIPKSAEKSLRVEEFGEMAIVGCSTVMEVINNVFTTDTSPL